MQLLGNGIFNKFERSSAKKTRLQSQNSIADSDSRSDSVFSDMDNRSNISNLSEISDKKDIFQKQNQIIDNRLHERKFVDKSDDNNFLNQFEPLKFDNPNEPVSGNAVHHKTAGTHSTSARFEMERNLALKGGFSNFENQDMIYGVVSKENFGIENLKPFFTTKGGYGNNSLHEQNQHSFSQRKMELFTGSDNLNHKEKTEQASFFAPVSGLTNIGGSPIRTDFFQSRCQVGRERRNELPVAQVRVTPGLGLGAYENNKNGLHEMTRVMPRTRDEIRTLNNQKEKTFEAAINHGMRGIRSPIQPKIVKRRPVTFAEHGPENLIKGVGSIKAPRITGEINTDNLATLNRGTMERDYITPPKNTNMASPQGLKTKIKPSIRQNFMDAGPRNLVHNESQKARGFEENYNLKFNQRMKKQSNDYLGPAGSQEIAKGPYYDPNNIPGQTNRSIHINNNRTGMIGTGMGAGKTVNFNDIPNITMRQLHQNNERAGNSLSGVQEMRAYNLNDMPNTTQREQFSRTDRAGANINGPNKAHSHNYNDAPNITLREMFANNDRAGLGISNQSNEKIKSYNYMDIPGLTNRDIHSKNDRTGAGIGNYQFEKPRLFNYDDIQNMTQREIFAQNDRAGTINNGEINKGPGINYNDIPNTTYREIHNITDRVGKGLNTAQFQKGKISHPDDIPNITNRAIHNKPDRIGAPGTQSENKGQIYNLNDVPDLTRRDIHNKNERAGAPNFSQSHGKGKMFNPDDIPNVTMRDIYARTERVGAVKEVNKIRSYNLDHMPEITKRDVHSLNDRAGSSVGSLNEAKKGISYNLNYIPDQTLRDIHSKVDRVGNGTMSPNKSSKTANYLDIPDITKRELHAQSERAGGAIKSHLGGKLWNPNDVMDSTKREMHSKPDRVGIIGSHQFDKGLIYNPNDIPDNTKRELHSKFDRSGAALGTQENNKSRLQNPNDIPDNTKREMHAKTDRTGIVGSVGINKHKAFSSTDIPNMTNRSIFVKNDRTGNIMSDNKGYTFDFINNIPNVPIKAMQVKNNFVAPLKGNEKDRNRADVNNMTVNIIKEQIAEGRYPTNSNFNKGPTFEFTTLRAPEKQQQNRELYPQFNEKYDIDTKVFFENL